jgi:hypothetical protein
MGHGASGCFAYIGPPNGPISIRAVHSSPFPPCAARRRGAPRWARGGPGWGAQGSLPDPAHLGPIYEKK